MTGIPQPGPRAAAAAVARAGRPPAGTPESATGGTAHDQIRDERVLDRRRAAWSDGRQVTGDGGRTAISGLPADTRPRHVVRARTAAPAKHPHRPGRSPRLTHPGPPPALATKHGLDQRHAPRAGTAHAPTLDVMMMSFTELERQALGSIADGLAGSDPWLASMLTIFSRLAAGEEMPAARRPGYGAGGRPPTVRAAPGGTCAGV